MSWRGAPPGDVIAAKYVASPASLTDGEIADALADVHGAIGGGHPGIVGWIADSVAILAGQTLTYDVATVGWRALYVSTIISGAAAQSVWVFPYDPSGVVHSSTVFVDSTKARVAQSQLDIAGGATQVSLAELFGTSKVQIQFRNNDTVTQTMTIWITLQK